MTDLDLMRLQVSALFLLNDEDRLLAVNEPDPPSAPRLFLGRTLAGDVWRFRHDLPESLIGEIDALLRAEPRTVDLTAPPRCLEAVKTALARHAAVVETSHGPAWRFPDELPGPEHDVIPVTPANDAAVRAVFPILADDLPWRQPCLAIVREGRLASVCYSARNTGEAAEAGVDTVEVFRGRGYAVSVASAWARAVRDEGRIPLYSTAWDNAASRAVAGKLGLILYGADLELS